jgi:hypothetical protein
MTGPSVPRLHMRQADHADDSCLSRRRRFSRIYVGGSPESGEGRDTSKTGYGVERVSSRHGHPAAAREVITDIA